MEGRERWQWRQRGSKWRRGGVCWPVVADSHHTDEEQGPDPDPHQNGKSDPDPHQSKNSHPAPHQRDADQQHWLKVNEI